MSLSERQSEIILAILICLDRVAPTQLVEAIIHADVQTQLRNRAKNSPSLSEFNPALVICDQRGWIIGIESGVRGRMKWSISDQGRAALIELQ